MSYGELLLIVGDLHSADMPSKLRALLVPDKMQRSLVTGNIGASMDYLRHITPQVNVVAGDMDDEPFPEEMVVDLGEFRVGLIHGHQVVPWGDKNALAAVARRLGADILVSGHTHAYSCEEHDGIWLINPGSATGYYSPLSDVARASFVCMSVMGGVITNYVYMLDEHSGEVQVKKDRLVKSGNELATAPAPAPAAARAEAALPPPQPVEEPARHDAVVEVDLSDAAKPDNDDAAAASTLAGDEEAEEPTSSND